MQEPNSQIIEQVPAKQLLATRPLLLEIYKYKNDVTIGARIESRVTSEEPFPKRMQMTIIDYFEVDNCMYSLFDSVSMVDNLS